MGDLETIVATNDVPDWALEAFHTYQSKHRHLSEVLRLSILGLHQLRRQHDLAVALHKLNRLGEDPDKQLKGAELDQQLAEQEAQSGFSLLYEHAAIAMWGNLEATMRGFVATWLANFPGAWQCEEVMKLRIRLGDYESLSQFDRCLWVVDLLDQEVSGPLRNGANRFESLLKPFGLAGSVESDCQKSLFELSQVRHVLVHRAGHADKRLIDACPWLELAAGKKLKVTEAMWRSYNAAIASYVLELIGRVYKRFGATMPSGKS